MQTLHPRELAHIRSHERQTAPDGLASHQNVIGADRRATRSQIGLDLSVVTIEDGRIGLSSNYLKVELARPREANRIETVRIAGLRADKLYETGSLPIL